MTNNISPLPFWCTPWWMERALLSESAVSDTQNVVPVLQELGKNAASSIICSVVGFLLLLHGPTYTSRYSMFFTPPKNSLKKLLQKAWTEKAAMLTDKYSINRTFRRKLFFSQAWDLGILFKVVKLWFQQQWHGTFIYTVVCIAASTLECFLLSI